MRPAGEQAGTDSTTVGPVLSQARVELEAKRGPVKIEIGAELTDAIDPPPPDQPPYLRDAWARFEVHDALRVYVGRFRRPFSRVGTRGRATLPTRSRGLTEDLIVNDMRYGERAVGLMIDGKWDAARLSWAAAVTQPGLTGLGADATGRVVFEVVDALDVGVSACRKWARVAGRGVVPGWGLGGDVKVETDRLYLSLDVMVAQDFRLAETPWVYGALLYGTVEVPLTDSLVLQPVLGVEYADADGRYAGSTAVRVVAGPNLLWHKRYRILPQIEVVRPVGEPSAANPWPASEAVYVLVSAQL